MNVRLLLAVAWTLGILAACTLPGAAIPAPQLWDFDKLAHFSLFAGFGWLWMRALEHDLYRRALAVLAAGVAYAVLSELYQGLLPWPRTPDPYDALADAAGAAAGVLLYVLRHRPRT